MSWVLKVQKTVPEVTCTKISALTRISCTRGVFCFFARHFSSSTITVRNMLITDIHYERNIWFMLYCFLYPCVLVCWHNATISPFYTADFIPDWMIAHKQAAFSPSCHSLPLLHTVLLAITESFGSCLSPNVSSITMMNIAFTIWFLRVRLRCTHLKPKKRSIMLLPCSVSFQS